MKSFQHEILRRLSKYDYHYIARDDFDKSLYAYKNKPSKHCGDCWADDSKEPLALIPVWIDDFDFIHWEDAEPYSIEELLKREVIDE